MKALSGSVVRAAFACVLAAGASSALAQTLPKYEVTGFREILFGMTEQEVRNTAVKAFGVKAADVTAGKNPVEGTNLLTAKLNSLDPGPGPAQISFIFGHASKRLIQVNVMWGLEATTTQPDPSTMIAAGTRLERYFTGFEWKKDAARAGIPVGDNTVVLFAGEDEKKGAVRLIVDGVKYQMQREGNQTTSPDPKTPPKLIINYIADRENPDIAKIERGKF
jgi:hypothetical protein